MGSKEERKDDDEEDGASAADVDRTNKHPLALMQDAIDNAVTKETSENIKGQRSSHSYVNVPSIDSNASDGVNSANVTVDASGDALYDDVTLEGISVSSVQTQENVPLTTVETSQDKLQIRQSLGNSMASESSTASYIDIEDEILSKRTSGGERKVSREAVKEEVVIQPKEDEYDLLANTTTTQEDDYDLLANVESHNISTAKEQLGSDDDTAIEKSSSSSCKDSGGYIVTFNIG